MLTDIRSFDFPLTTPIGQRIEARVAAALAGAADRPHRVTVRLRDVNASRGGVDKRCRIVADLGGRAVAVADALASDLYAAIDAAARRLRRVVMRAAKQRRARRRRREPRRAGSLAAA